MHLAEKMKQTLFSDNLPANIFTLTNKKGSSISLMDIGATWLSCKIQMADELREVLLGVDSMHKHLQQQVYLGATIGRYANRIQAGQFAIDGQIFQISINQTPHMLHSGVDGFDKRRWQVSDDNEVSIEYRANMDKTCPVNLTNHGYFNLMGADLGWIV